MKDILFFTVTLFDVVGAVIISMSMFSPALHYYSKGFKAGLVLAMLGLIGQAFRNYIYITTGVSPTDAEVPLWAFKDLGISVFSISWLWLKMKEHK